MEYEELLIEGFKSFISFLEKQDKIKTGKDLVPKLHYDWFYFLPKDKGRIDCCLRSSLEFGLIMDIKKYDAIINIEYRPSQKVKDVNSWTPERDESFVCVFNHKSDQPITKGWERERDVSN